MQTNNELDARLAESLQEPELADDGFTRHVMGKLQRQRSGRRRILGAATAAACMPVIVGAWLSPASFFGGVALSAGTGMAAIVLAATCGVVWIMTESRLAGLSRAAAA